MRSDEDVVEVASKDGLQNIGRTGEEPSSQNENNFSNARPHQPRRQIGRLEKTTGRPRRVSPLIAMWTQVHSTVDAAVRATGLNSSLSPTA
jgi:hypothetical protein